MCKTNPKAIEPTIPLPPSHFMELVCGGKRDDLTAHFLSVGERLVSALHEHELIRDTSRVLDIGCGCGRVARFLVDKNLATYTGFDRHPEMIDWCEREISSRKQTFTFYCFNIKSSYQIMDGLIGEMDAAHFSFPFEDDSFDLALLSSVFTHMPLEETQQYLRELSRTLAPEGGALLSVFLTTKKPYSQGINYYYHPMDFRDAVASSGLTLTTEQWDRLTCGDGLDYDNWQHNWFILQSERQK